MEKNGQFSPMNLPIAFMVTFHSYVSLPIGVSTMRVYIYIYGAIWSRYIYIYICVLVRKCLNIGLPQLQLNLSSFCLFKLPYVDISSLFPLKPSSKLASSLWKPWPVR